MSCQAVSLRLIFLLGLAVAILGSLRAADPLTDEECHQFGRQFAMICRQNDSITLKQLEDYDALADHTLNGLELDEAQKNRSRGDYNELYDHTSPQTLRLGQQRIFYYSGILNYDNRRCVVIDSCTNGFNLCLVAIARAADGKPKCTDIYNVSDATWESELRRIQILSRLPKEVLMRQSIDILRPLRVTPNLKKINDLFAAGKREDGTDLRDEAIEQIEKLSEKSRSQKLLLRTAAILYAAAFNKEKFRAEIEHWKALYPQDLSANFHAYLGYLQLGDDEAAIRELQELKMKTGSNPYLQFLLSYRYYERGNLEEAKKAALMATSDGIRCDPIVDHWDIQIKISLKEKDYRETVRVLGDITRTFPDFSTQKMVDTKSDFQEFRQSDEYTQWMAGKDSTHK